MNSVIYNLARKCPPGVSRFIIPEVSVVRTDILGVFSDRAAQPPILCYWDDRYDA